MNHTPHPTPTAVCVDEHLDTTARVTGLADLAHQLATHAGRHGVLATLADVQAQHGSGWTAQGQGSTVAWLADTAMNHTHQGPVRIVNHYGDTLATYTPPVMVSKPVRLDQAQEAIERLTGHLTALGVPAATIQALVGNTDPGPCHNLRGGAICQLDLGHHHKHLAVWPPDPGTKTQTEWASTWSEHDIKKHGAYDKTFTLPDAATPAMRARTQLVDEPRVFICQPVTDTLLYVHIRLGRNDTGLTSWLRRIGLKHGQATRTEHGDYLARGHLNGARVALIAHAHSYR